MRSRNDPGHPEAGSAWFITVDEALVGELSDVRVKVEVLRDHLETFSALIRESEGRDKLGSFEINQLMSDYNQAETLASSVQKKVNDTIACVIRKI